MTQSISPPTRRLVKSANRFPRSARTPNRAASSSTTRSRSNPYLSVRSLANFFFFQQTQQLIGYPVHRARAESQHEIARLYVLTQNGCGVIERTDVVRVLVSETFNGSRQRFCCYAFNRILTGSINVCDEQHISVIEGARKLLHQIVCSRVTMRLKQNDDAPSA